MLFNEAIADGLDKKAALEDTNSRLNFLNDRPELLGITTTPLSLRLIRTYLKEDIKTKSLGDLIYDIILERIGNWDIKDSKNNSYNEFKKYFPDSFSREHLLGVIAKEIIDSDDKKITLEQLKIILKELSPSVVEQNIIVEQAANFFVKSILQNENDNLSFPSQPILQGAVGINIYEQLIESGEINIKVEKKSFWREYSFAASVARRKNQLSSIREKLINFFDELIVDENYVPAIAIIVSESENEELAKHFISLLKNLDFRPLRYFQDIKTQSVRAIAHSIYLARDEGFDWFYEEYVNPIYPNGIHWDDEPFNILQHWFIFCDFYLTDKQQQKLSSTLAPHLGAKDWACHRLPQTLVMILPQLFDKEKELLMYVANIDSDLFGNIAIEKLKKEVISGNSDKVINAIEIFISNNEKPKQKVLKLWLELANTTLPLEIVRGIILNAIEEKNSQIFRELEKRIGEKILKSILRFYVFQDSKIAAASAILLYRMGEKKFYPLATGLLQGLHDGGKIEDAEEVLHILIKNRGIAGISWLVNKFPKSDSTYGAHSAYWRILLTELNNEKLSHIDLLSKAIPYLGEFILPRYPEIRLELKKLLTSKPDYRSFLEQSLHSIDNHLRYNSACILLACFPESEEKACEIIINSTTAYFDRDEWWRFCLRLSLGKEVKEYIFGLINCLLPVPKTFALTLLYHNNFPLSSELFGQLILGLLNKGSKFDLSYSFKGDNLKRILAQDESYNLLIKFLNNDNLEVKTNAAAALLSYHKVKLSENDYSICWGLNISEMFRWRRENIDKELIGILQNNYILKKVEKIFKKIQEESNQEPLPSLYIRASENLEVW